MTSDSTNARPPLHTSAHYGIASIAIAGIFLIMGVPALQLANELQLSGYRGFGPGDLRAAAYGGYVGATLLILTSLGAAGMAIQGIRVAGRRDEPAVLCIAGLLLSLLSALLCTGCLLAWHAQMGGTRVFH